MESVKQLLLTNWHSMRWIRLILGIALLVHAILSHDVLSGMLATFLLFQAILNAGCCGTSGCDIPMKKKKES